MTASRRRAAIAAALAVLVVGCGGGGNGEVSAADLVHVHGLAEHPEGEGFYVATHTGLFQVEGEEISRVGEATHDLMGFTVAGSDDYLASGHPDRRVDELQAPGKPPLLGLVHSDDGVDWEALSLLGEADFHALEAAHGRVYGFDSTSGRFMVSDDRVNWEERAEVALFDFAVSPSDADVIVATGQGGIARSDDGGATWTGVSRDDYVFVDWSEGGLYGVAVDGRVGVSSDAGETWTSVGSVQGQPEALLVTDERLLVAVAERGILESTDGGEHFEVLVQTGG